MSGRSRYPERGGEVYRQPTGSSKRLEDIPYVGKAIAADLRYLGIETPSDLKGRDPYELYDTLCDRTGIRHDPCLLDTFIAAVRYVEGGPKLPWWAFTAERKRALAKRDQP